MFWTPGLPPMFGEDADEESIEDRGFGDEETDDDVSFGNETRGCVLRAGMLLCGRFNEVDWPDDVWLRDPSAGRCGDR